MLSRKQHLSIFCFIALFLLLYFGCNTKSKKQSELVKTRSNKVEIISIQKIIHDSRDKLLPEAKARVDLLNSGINNNADNDTLVIRNLELLSSEWFGLENPLLAGHYAKQIALKKNDEQSWSITGTTFYLALKKATDKKELDYCTQQATSSFEKAISLNPDNIDHRINLALTYVENPEEDNPMQGVLMMLDLNQKNPNNVKVLSQLGQLSLRTNQIDKAIERFTQVLKIDPNNKNANCLLGEIYGKQGRKSESERYLAKCN